MSGSARTNPILLDSDSESDQDISRISKTGINSNIAERQLQLPTRNNVISPAKKDTKLNDRRVNDATAHRSVSKQPQSSLVSHLFHPAKKPDTRPASQKPILHQSAATNSVTRLSTPLRSSPQSELKQKSLSRTSRTQSPIQDKSHPRGLTASSSHGRFSQHPDSTGLPKDSGKPFRLPFSNENDVSGPINVGGVTKAFTAEKQKLQHSPPGWKGLGPGKKLIFTDGRAEIPPLWQSSPSTSESETSLGKWFRPASQQPPLKASTTSSGASSRAPTGQRDSVPAHSSQLTVEIDNTLPLSREEYKDVSERKRGLDVANIGTSKRPRRETSTSSSVISHHDLHLFYAYDEDDDKRKRLGQPKAKKVDRTSIPLELDGPVLDSGITAALDALELKQKRFLHPQQQVQKLMEQKFEGIEGLSFTNELDESMLDGKFEFTDSYIPSDLNTKQFFKDVRPEEFYTGCNDKLCDAEHCSCVYKEDIEDDFEDVIGVDEHRAYQFNSDQSITLRDDFLAREDGVIRECNATCGCGPDCLNRLVQRGRKVPLNIFKTKKCGFGVRSPVNLKKGAFIDTYLGELVSERTLDEREKVRNDATPSNQSHTSYVFSLDNFDSLARFENKPLHVDGANYGSPMRFVNHSCEPNCKVITVIPDIAATVVYSLAFFTTKDIASWTELTIDYDPISAGKKFNDTAIDEDMIRCYCGSARCRRLLWPLKNPQGRRGRPRKY